MHLATITAAADMLPCQNARARAGVWRCPTLTTRSTGKHRQKVSHSWVHPGKKVAVVSVSCRACRECYNPSPVRRHHRQDPLRHTTATLRSRTDHDVWRFPGLVRQVVNAAKDVGIPLLGENALEGGIYNPEVRGKHDMASGSQGTWRL